MIRSAAQVDMIRSYMSKDWHLSLQHTLRQGNSVAYGLAKEFIYFIIPCFFLTSAQMIFIVSTLLIILV